MGVVRLLNFPCFIKVEYKGCLLYTSNELNKRFDSNDKKFDNRFNELKYEIQEINKCVENSNETIRSSLTKLEQSMERMEVVVMNPNKNKTNENDNDNVENNECNTESSSVFEELVSESDTVEINSESTGEIVGCDNEMLMSVYELEREWKESIVAVSYTHLDVYKRQGM